MPTVAKTTDEDLILMSDNDKYDRWADSVDGPSSVERSDA